MNTRASSLPEVGEELVGFQLTARLGEGGMAAVFRGENLLDRSIVRAIKVVRPELASRSEFRARIAEEARILERLSHKGIVRFHGVRQDRGLLVLELELLDGESLAGMLGRGYRFGLRDAVDCVLQAAEGVAAAHAMGVVHRDLKPDNLFRTSDGQIKVLDFGIARALDEADRATRATTAGTTPGTAAYIPPEVWSGGVPGETGDVYALGLSLMELLLGHHPFQRPGDVQKSSPQLMFMHIQGELPAIRSIHPRAPELLEPVVAKATAKQPAARYPNAGALADALRAVLAQLPSGERVVGAAMGSLTDFALPQLQVGATTGRAVVGAPAAFVQRRRGLGMMLTSVAFVALAGGALLYTLTRAKEQTTEAPAPMEAAGVLGRASATTPGAAPGATGTEGAAQPNAAHEDARDAFAPVMGAYAIVWRGGLRFGRGIVGAVKGNRALVGDEELGLDDLSFGVTPVGHEWQVGESVLVMLPGAQLVPGTIQHVRIDNQLLVNTVQGESDVPVIYSPPLAIKQGQRKLEDVFEIRPEWRTRIRDEVVRARAALRKAREDAEAAGVVQAQREKEAAGRRADEEAKQLTAAAAEAKEADQRRLEEATRRRAQRRADIERQCVQNGAGTTGYKNCVDELELSTP